MKTEKEIDPELLKQLSAIQPVAERSPVAAQKGRQAFEQLARELQAGVSVAPQPRLNMWTWIKQSLLSSERKERVPMLNVISTLVLVFSLVLGGTGITAAAAQGSLPDEPLYSIKLLAEDIRLWLTADPQQKIQLLLTYTDRRTLEIEGMTQAGKATPEAVQLRYQNQVDQAIRLAAGLPVEEVGLALEKIRANLQTQEQAMLQLQTNNPGLADPIMEQTRQMLRERLQWVEDGLEDPVMLKTQIQQRDRDQFNKPTTAPRSTQDSPGNGDGNPWVDGTPTPGSGAGPGPGEGAGCANCTPVDNGNPWTTGTPTPQSGYGPGPGTPGSGPQQSVTPPGPGGNH